MANQLNTTENKKEIKNNKSNETKNDAANKEGTKLERNLTRKTSNEDMKAKWSPRDKWVIERFVENLEQLRTNKDFGALAYLKRNVRRTIGASKNAISVFYRLVPNVVIGSKYEEIYFLVSTLFGVNPEKGAAEKTSFGKTLARLKQEINSESFERRFMALLNSSFDVISDGVWAKGDLSHRLSQFVRMLKSKGIPINWYEITRDLLFWMDDENRSIQKKWARDFFGNIEKD